MAPYGVRKISNVLTVFEENRLQVSEITFNEKILKIHPTSDTSLDWSDINNKDKWLKIQKNLTAPNKENNNLNINGRFLLLMPGAIDTHVHFNTPGFEERDDFEHGSFAAAKGGVSLIFDMPCTSIPPVTNVKNLEIKEKEINGRSWVDYGFWGGVAGNDFTSEKKIEDQIYELNKAGVVGFKAYLISGMESFTELSISQMYKSANIVLKTGKPLAVHAEDKEMVVERRKRLQKLGQNNWVAYCKARDDRAEAGAISNMVSIARRTGCKIHIVHLSSEWGLNLVCCAQEEGLSFTAETCPHYLYFTSDEFENSSISSFLKTAPPVKTEYDREALWEGLKNGTISFVTTDHAGCDPEKEKKSENFWEIYGGFPGVQHRVPFMFSEGFLKGRLTLEQTIQHLSTNPAQYFNVHPQKGALAVGSDADFVLINLWDTMTVRASEMYSKGKYTPFEGIKFNALVENTYVRGKMVTDRVGNSEVKIGYGERITI
jgi:allantoinase